MKISKEHLKQIVREELKNLSEKEISLSGKEVANRIKNSKDKNHKMFFGKKALSAIAKKSKLTAKELDHMLPDYIPGNLIHGLFTEAEVNEMRPHVAKDLPGETIWDHISDHYDWEDYLGKGGMKELEKSLKKMKRVKPQQLDQMLPGYIPADEVYDIFRNSLAVGPTEKMKITKSKLKEIIREELAKHKSKRVLTEGWWGWDLNEFEPWRDDTLAFIKVPKAN